MKNKILLGVVCFLGLALIVESVYIFKVKRAIAPRMRYRAMRQLPASGPAISRHANKPVMPPKSCLPSNVATTAQPASEWDPVAEMEMMQRNMNRMFVNLARDVSSVRPELFRKRIPLVEISMDISEMPDSYVVLADIPGMNKKDINIEVAGNLLTISGERKSDQEISGRGYKHSERIFGAFSKTITLPDDIKRNEIRADYKNGVLSVIIPKAQVVKKPLKAKVEIM